ncbi:MAG: extracellular solute-binding protein, partial [Anaerolineaceae bacterium]|nr:extracellular solute-binding protein [Anaerolineaceae bacterium]
MFKKIYKILIVLIISTMLLTACGGAAPEDAALSEAEARIAELEAALEESKAAGATSEELADLQAQLVEAQASAVPELPMDLDEFYKADIDWHALADAAGEEGLNLHVAVVKHTYTDSLLPLIPVFEELTGINVFFDMLPQAEYWPKLGVDLSSGSGLIDVYMTGPELVWAYVPPGWAEPLDDYVNDPTLTDPDWYDQADFSEAAWDANRWDGQLGHGGYGTGPVYAVPVTFEIMSIAYRPDLMEEAGVVIDEGWPHTWQDVIDAAKATTKDTDGDGNVDQYGILTRGNNDWSSMFGGYSNLFYSWGALDFDENMVPVVNSDLAIEATEMWVDLVQVAAPADMTDYQWYQVSQGFAQGNAAMVIDCDWWAAATYEQPDISQVAGELSYAITPPGPTGERVQDIWFWSLGINGASYHKDAAWLFIEWATSKPVMRIATLEYNNWNPSRESIWNDPEVVALTEQWSNYRAVVEESRNYAKVPHAV